MVSLATALLLAARSGGQLIYSNLATEIRTSVDTVRRWVESVTLVTADGDVARLARGAEPAPTFPPRPNAAALARFERDTAPAIREASELIRSRFPRTTKNSSGFALDA